MTEMNLSVTAGTRVEDIVNQIELLTDDLQNSLEELAHLYSDGALDEEYEGMSPEGLSGMFGVLLNTAHIAHVKARYAAMELAKRRASTGGEGK